MYFAVFCNRFSIWSEQKRRVGRTPRMAPYRHAAAVQIDTVPFGKAGKPAADVAGTALAWPGMSAPVYSAVSGKRISFAPCSAASRTYCSAIRIFSFISGPESICTRPAISSFHLFVPSFHMLSCDFSAYTLVYYIVTVHRYPANCNIRSPHLKFCFAKGGLLTPESLSYAAKQQVFHC